MILDDPFLKDYIVDDIIREVETKGFNIEKVYVENFIENFQEEYDRLPKKSEIGSIAKSYVKIIQEEDVHSQNIQKTEITENLTLEEEIEFVVKDFVKKKNLINTITEDPIFKYSGEILTIPKPDGRRMCPICGDESWFKIHEFIDKSYVICDYPRIYGKKFRCNGCGIEWHEK